MPIYTYTCPKCRHQFGLFRPLPQSAKPAACPKCDHLECKALSKQPKGSFIPEKFLKRGVIIKP